MLLFRNKQNKIFFAVQEVFFCVLIKNGSAHLYLVLFKIGIVTNWEKFEFCSL